jgi:hypothetical protein
LYADIATGSQFSGDVGAQVRVQAEVSAVEVLPLAHARDRDSALVKVNFVEDTVWTYAKTALTSVVGQLDGSSGERVVCETVNSRDYGADAPPINSAKVALG